MALVSRAAKRYFRRAKYKTFRRLHITVRNSQQLSINSHATFCQMWSNYKECVPLELKLEHFWNYADLIYCEEMQFRGKLTNLA